MNQNILHVGLDFDDTQYRGSAFNKEAGEVIALNWRPTLKSLLTQLDKLQRHFQGLSIRLRYPRGAPQRIYCDNGAEFTSRILDLWAYHNQVTIECPRPDKPTDNGQIHSVDSLNQAAHSTRDRPIEGQG